MARLLRLSNLNDLIFNDRKNSFIFLWLDQVRSGKTTESRQHSVMLCEIKTGEAQRLFTRSFDMDAGMDMAAEGEGWLSARRAL